MNRGTMKGLWISGNKFLSKDGKEYTVYPMNYVKYEKSDFPMEAEIKGVILAGYQSWPFMYKYADYLEPLFETNAPLMTNVKSAFVLFLKKMAQE